MTSLERSPSVNMSSPAIVDEDSTVVSVVLSCELTKSSETKQIRFKSPPDSPLAIKQKVEETFSIPACIQTLQYQSMLLKDSDELHHARFRSGDTFTIHYQTNGDCEKVYGVIEWLRAVLKELQDVVDDIYHNDDDKDPNRSMYLCKRAEDCILSGMQNGAAQDFCLHLFYPWKDKRKYVNKLHFQHEGGLDALMKVYGLLVEEDWGNLGINSEFHLYMECLCCQAVANYTQTFPLRRQVVQLGGLEMCAKTLLRKEMGRNGGCKILPDTLEKSALEIALYAVCNLSELPECQLPLAMRRDVVDQTMAIALHPVYDCKTAIVSASLILCLTQSPEAHVHLARKELVKDMMEMCALKRKMVMESLPQPQGEKEDPMSICALEGYTSIILAQIGLGSPDLLYKSIPLDLQRRTLDLMSTMLEATSPAEISQYEEKEGLVWGTFLPYLRFLYNPTTVIDRGRSVENSEDNIMKTRSLISQRILTDLHILCCKVLLHGLENALGREIHFQILVKEGLLDYSTCLPAVLPQECKPRARSFVKELGKHRQLQPASLCTLAKAHLAKSFCGLKAVMDMHSIGEFVHNCLSGPLRYIPGVHDNVG